MGYFIAFLVGMYFGKRPSAAQDLVNEAQTFTTSLTSGIPGDGGGIQMDRQAGGCPAGYVPWIEYSTGKPTCIDAATAAAIQSGQITQ